MLAIQILINLFALYAIFRVAQKIKQKSLTRGWGVLWILFWLVVGLVVSLPWTTSLLAARLGVTRGVDLVVYVSILALFYLVFRLTVKNEKLERNITELVRQVALGKSEIRNPKSETNPKDQDSNV
jgi:hypothetical protein